MIIDAHQHYWRVDRGDYGWLTPTMEPLYRDFLPGELTPQLNRAGVDATVLVQAAPTEAETRYLLDLAARTPSVAGVVGWVDMDANDVGARIDLLQRHCGSLLKGMRPMIQDMPDDGWVMSRDLDKAFSALESADMTFDALVHPRHLQPLLRRLERNPELRTVIDHCGKPDIAKDGFAGWAEDMHSIALGTDAYCKLSGLLSQLDEHQAADDVRPYVEHILDAFGPQRVIWGSDWPVLVLHSDYQQWFELTNSLLAGLTQEDRDAVLGGSAQRFYRLPADAQAQAILSGRT